MATRFRLTSDATAPAVSPTLQSWSHNAPTTVRRQLLLTDASALSTIAYTPDAADHLVTATALFCQYVSDEMVAGKVFAQNDAIKLVVQCLEAHTNNNLFVSLTAAIFNSAGTIERRRLITFTTNDGTELATALTARNVSLTQNGASYTTVAGDRIVVEFGVQGTPASAGGVQGHNASFRIGSNGAGGDLLENDTETGTTRNPWIEFVPSDLFAPPSTTLTPGPVAATPSVPGSTLALENVFGPGPLAAVTAVPAPTVSVSSTTTITPDPVVVLLAMPGPTLALANTFAPAPIVAATAAPAPGIATALVLAPAPVAAQVALPALGVATALTLEPVPVVAQVALPAPSLSLATSLSPGPVTAVLAVPQPTLDAGAGATTLSPGPVSAAAAVPAPLVSLALGLLPAPVLLATAVPTPTLGLGALVLVPAPIAAVTAVPAPVVSAGVQHGSTVSSGIAGPPSSGLIPSPIGSGAIPSFIKSGGFSLGGG